MSEPGADAIDRQLQAWARDARSRFAVPPFDGEWDAARARLAAGTAAPEEAPTRRRLRWRWRVQAWAAPATLAAIVMVLVVSWPTSRAPAPTPASEPGSDAVNLVWYTPTDELLDASAMRYDALPARFTYYDPITMEVIQ